jgi:hypothetical protein
MPKSMQNVFFLKIISNAAVWYFGPLNFPFDLDCHCTMNDACSGEATNTNCIVFGLTRPGLESTSAALEASTLKTITQ